jgi:hypothetical protein
MLRWLTLAVRMPSKAALLSGVTVSAHELRDLEEVTPAEPPFRGRSGSRDLQRASSGNSTGRIALFPTARLLLEIDAVVSVLLNPGATDYVRPHHQTPRNPSFANINFTVGNSAELE